MSDTPRTDSKASRHLLNIGETTTKYEVVPAEFARQLERELAEAREEAAYWEKEARRFNLDCQAAQSQAFHALKDAERYRWLRDGNNYIRNIARYSGVSFDNRVDAARKEGK